MIKCACCGSDGQLFYSTISDQCSFCRACFTDPSLWFPTKERIAELEAWHKAERRLNPMQMPLGRFLE